jgi:hypothetical protein
MLPSIRRWRSRQLPVQRSRRESHRRALLRHRRNAVVTFTKAVTFTEAATFTEPIPFAEVVVIHWNPRIHGNDVFWTPPLATAPLARQAAPFLPANRIPVQSISPIVVSYARSSLPAINAAARIRPLLVTIRRGRCIRIAAQRSGRRAKTSEAPEPLDWPRLSAEILRREDGNTQCFLAPWRQHIL